MHLHEEIAILNEAQNSFNVDTASDSFTDFHGLLFLVRAKQRNEGLKVLYFVFRLCILAL